VGVAVSAVVVPVPGVSSGGVEAGAPVVAMAVGSEAVEAGAVFVALPISPLSDVG
jgi:hypothetical protein